MNEMEFVIVNKLEFIVVVRDDLIGFRYSVYVVPVGGASTGSRKYIKGASTLWGAMRVIRKERRRRKRHGADGRIVHREAL